MWRNWDEMSLRGHVHVVLGMLVAGVVVSLLLQLSGRLDSAWLVVVVVAAAASGALFRLDLRLRRATAAAGEASR